MKFQTPPASRLHARGKSRYLPEDVQRQLRARPGEWALVHESVDYRVGQALRAFAERNPEWEMTTRGSKTQDVYVRYVGDQS